MKSIASGLKKVLCLLLSAGVVLSLASCSGSPSGTAEKGENGNSSTPVTLNWYMYLDAIQPDQAKVIDKLNEYLKDKNNVTINAHFFEASEYGTKMPVIISSGQDYDICFAATWGTVNYVQTATTGAFMKLDQNVLEKEAPETLKAIPDMIWDSSKVNGNIYGVPCYKEAGMQYGLMVNADIAREYGIDYKNVKSWEDLEGVLSKLHQKAPDIIGLDPVALWGAVNFTQIVSSSVGVVNIPGHEVFADQKENTVVNQYAAPEFKDFCNTMHKWFKAGYLPQNPQTYSDDTRNSDDKAGRLFSWVIGYAPDYEKTYSSTVGHNEDYIPLTPVLFQGASNFQCISAKSKNQEAALQFLNLVNTDKTVGNLLRHGIEGVHYKMSNGRVEQTDKSYGFDMGWQFGSVFNQNWVSTYPADIAESYENWNAQAVDNPLLGFTFDDSNSKNQIAALTNVVKQYADPLVLGTVDQTQTLSAFLKALNENGVEDLLKEEQKQVDAFLNRAK